MKCPRCHFENPETTRFCGNCGAPVPGSKEGSPTETRTLLTPVSGLDRGSLFAGRYEVIFDRRMAVWYKTQASCLIFLGFSHVHNFALKPKGMRLWWKTPFTPPF